MASRVSPVLQQLIIAVIALALILPLAVVAIIQVEAGREINLPNGFVAMAATAVSFFFANGHFLTATAAMTDMANAAVVGMSGPSTTNGTSGMTTGLGAPKGGGSAPGTGTTSIPSGPAGN